jgi:CYTH domain-containing protein
MAQEIERKFLVHREKLPNPLPVGEQFVQAYLSTRPTVRVRIIDGARAVMTVKGRGLSNREEIEFPVPLEDARALVKLSPYNVIEKTRYRIPFKGLTWEVDEYHGALAGFWSAEVELQSIKQQVELPPFVDKEVTGNGRYQNSALAQNGVPT